MRTDNDLLEYEEARNYITRFDDFCYIETDYGFVCGRKDGDVVTISRMYVYEINRKLGLGKKLVAQYEKLHADTIIRIKSKPDAKGFWLKQGYNFINEEGEYYVGFKQTSSLSG